MCACVRDCSGVEHVKFRIQCCEKTGNYIRRNLEKGTLKQRAIHSSASGPHRCAGGLCAARTHCRFGICSAHFVACACRDMTTFVTGCDGDISRQAAIWVPADGSPARPALLYAVYGLAATTQLTAELPLCASAQRVIFSLFIPAAILYLPFLHHTFY